MGGAGADGCAESSVIRMWVIYDSVTNNTQSVSIFHDALGLCIYFVRRKLGIEASVQAPSSSCLEKQLIIILRFSSWNIFALAEATSPAADLPSLRPSATGFRIRCAGESYPRGVGPPNVVISGAVSFRRRQAPSPRKCELSRVVSGELEHASASMLAIPGPLEVIRGGLETLELEYRDGLGSPECDPWKLSFQSRNE